MNAGDVILQRDETGRVEVVGIVTKIGPLTRATYLHVSQANTAICSFNVGINPDDWEVVE